MRQLSELDASFLYLESETSPMHIGGIYIFDASDRDTPLAFRTFVAYLRSRLHVVPLFRQRLREVPFRLGRPCWIDDTGFSIERHLAYVSLGKNGDQASLMKLASRILEQPLKRDRPLWHITFVDGFHNSEQPDEPGDFALIVKLHHAAIDAFSGEEIIAKLLEYSPSPRRIDPPRSWSPAPAPPGERVILQTGANLARKPLQITSIALSAAAATARGIIQKQMRRLPLPFPFLSAPHSPFNRQITANRRFVAGSVDLSRLKTIKAMLGSVTLNDVVLGLCAETLRRYMLAQNMKTNRSLVAMTPISVRSSSLRKATGNQMSAMLLDLATNEPDPADRIRRIHWNAVESEPYREAIAADRLTELLPSTMLALSARLYSEFQIAQRYQPAFNLPITNVPGPQVPLYLQGAKLACQFNTAPLFDGMGLVIVAVSYQGRLTINFTLCPDVVVQGESLKSLLEQSLDAIETAAADLAEEPMETHVDTEAHPTLTDDALTLVGATIRKTVARFRK